MAKENDTKGNDPKGKSKEKAVNTRTLPAIIVLSAALISCAFSLLQGVEFRVFVARLFFSVLIFGTIGIIVRVVLDRYFFNRNSKEEEEAEEKDQDDGEEQPSEEGDSEDREES